MAPIADHNFLWNTIKVLATFVGLLTTMVAVVSAVCAWAYKAGSVRLGVVDLFACEISTLCRVTTVIDTVGRLMGRIERGAQAENDQTNPPSANQFTSAENYFPVFEGNTRDLQSLEARVVINITSFYTYMKTVRDLMRTAAVLKPRPEANNVDQLRADTWRSAMRDVIYMLFLGLEAGRSAIQDLVEFDPERAERTIVILLSELKAYLFLLQEFCNSDNMRARRLLLRWKKYQQDIKALRLEIQKGVKAMEKDHQPIKDSTEALTLELWQGAEKLLPDLEMLRLEVETQYAQAIRANTANP